MHQRRIVTGFFTEWVKITIYYAPRLSLSLRHRNDTVAQRLMPTGAAIAPAWLLSPISTVETVYILKKMVYVYYVPLGTTSTSTVFHVSGVD